MNKELENLNKQQLNNYKLAIKEIIKNNTSSLVNSDISSLIEEPPLDSMDVIKNKLLEVAKTYKIVLDSENSKKLINNFRKELIKDLVKIEEFRITPLIENVEKFEPVKDLDIIKITKKELNSINKKINSSIKKYIQDDVNKLLIENINNFFVDLSKCDKKDKAIDKLNKYLKKNYQRQLIENINMKILVKDTTLINGVKEQGERYIFTKNNSRLSKLEEVS